MYKIKKRFWHFIRIPSFVARGCNVRTQISEWYFPFGAKFYFKVGILAFSPSWSVRFNGKFRNCPFQQNLTAIHGALYKCRYFSTEWECKLGWHWWTKSGNGVNSCSGAWIALALGPSWGNVKKVVLCKRLDLTLKEVFVQEVALRGRWPPELGLSSFSNNIQNQILSSRFTQLLTKIANLHSTDKTQNHPPII